MHNPAPPRLAARLSAALLLCLSWGRTFADEPSVPAEAKASCSGQYQPEFKQRWNLDKAGWEDLCGASARPGGRLDSKRPAGRDPAVGIQAGAAAAQRALETGDFNSLYDKSRGGIADGGDPVLVPLPPPAATAQPIKGQAAAAAAKGAAAPADAPINPKQVAAHFKYEPSSGRPSSKKEQAFVKSVTSELQKSEEGRKIMRGIIAEGIVVSMQPTEFPGSPIVKKGNLEEIDGSRGMAIPDQKAYLFNANYMKMKDKEVALESVASNAGHEFNHILTHALVKKLFQKEGYDEVFKFALVDEQSARLKGYVVAYELNKGKPNGYIEEARGLLDNPDAYWENMKLWFPSYARALDLDEMKDPVRSYQQRLQALTDKRDELDQEGPDLDDQLRRLDHMGDYHQYAKQLTELRSLFQTDQDTLPTRTQSVKDSIDLVKQRISFLQSPQGIPLADKIKAAAVDPKFIALFGAMEGDLQKLEVYKDSKPVPKPKPTPGQMGWKAYEKRWNELHDDAPGQDPPWTEKP